MIRFNPAAPGGPAIDWTNELARRAERSRHPALQTFYQAGCATGDTPLESVPLVALDIETTGLDARRDAIVSIGLVPFDLQRIRCRDAFYEVVKPTTPLSEESITFHRITHSDIRQAPPMAAVLDKVLKAMAGKIMVVHYRAIERAFLDRAVQQHLGEPLTFPVIDTMQLEARLHRGSAQPGWLARLFGRKIESIRLADSRLRYGLPPYSAHHALTDALATAELLQAQTLHHYSPTTALRELWS
ncbi:3'-5' exonuclease [Halopseudomonas pachastrellae]|uniref:3'-5' exonuclease n=1 Tax=Halopseudomonas pachastrellae TaxID=254161 RepID=UPI003D7E1710|tara:strand:- start:1150 stop:1881 length:732 start_codon:yes stop_codon:yes gene_type:complete